MMMIPLFALFLFGVASASYCGQAGVPFSIEIAPNGQPILGCARPICFGWKADGRRSADAAQFYQIGSIMDGFIRSSDHSGPAAKNASIFQPQFAVCDRNFMSERCVGQNEWVGGIFPQGKIDSTDPMKIMCCTYEKLRTSQDRGILRLRPGQAVQGGEIRNEEGRQQGFEYISSIERMFDDHGVVYTVRMRSFGCVPEPNGPASVEDGAAKYLVDNINAIDHPATKKPTSKSSTPAPELPNLLGLPTLGPLPGFGQPGLSGQTGAGIPGIPNIGSAPAPQSVDNESPSFDERTFQLPDEMPAEDPAPALATLSESPSPSSSSRPRPVPIAQPYEEEEAPVQQQFARAHSAPVVPVEQAVPLPSRPQPQYLRPQPTPIQPQIQLQLPQNPFETMGLGNPFAPPQLTATPTRARAHGIRTYGPGARIESAAPIRRWGPQVVEQQLQQQQIQQMFNPFGWMVETTPTPPAVRELPKIRIPTVEEVENAIPKEGKQIISDVARTFLAALH
ncbi:unnamed protein product [Bursaphelenchus xylophilus]|uniref:(pine wood nematode) hypothetical protein n=1 Tax=Bursaphelenchus xylophilus TaxID=6326 RepID=A0A1I7SDF6_BURXY|nr:unnamed protein product [Bursaphelenchus xylophilus]CAG9130659.1 unnamed protein product [Bursaphelenchus xylophilus]